MILPVIINHDLPEVDVRLSYREDGSPCLIIGRKGSFPTKDDCKEPPIEGKWHLLEALGNLNAGWLVTFVIPRTP